MSNISTDGLAFGSNLGYLQRLEPVSVTLNFPSTTIASGAWSTQVVTTLIPADSLMTPRIKFSFDSDYILGSGCYSITDLDTLTNFFRLAEVDTGTGFLTLRVSTYNRSGVSETVPDFSVTADVILYRSSFDQS